RAELAASNAKSLFEAAEKAALAVEASRPGSETYLTAMAEIKKLETSRGDPHNLRAELNTAATQIAAARAEQSSVRELIAKAESAVREVTELLPKAAEQEALERRIAGLRERVSAAKVVEAEYSALESQLKQLREKFASNTTEIKANAEKAAVAGELIELEKRSGELITSLAALQAGLEREIGRA